jgi:hypothetical protein
MSRCRLHVLVASEGVVATTSIVLDYGPESTGRVLEAYANHVDLCFRPGKAIENAYVESFNGKCRDE